MSPNQGGFGSVVLRLRPRFRSGSLWAPRAGPAGGPGGVSAEPSTPDFRCTDEGTAEGRERDRPPAPWSRLAPPSLPGQLLRADAHQAPGEAHGRHLFVLFFLNSPGDVEM